MKLIERLDRDARRELPCFRGRSGSQVPHDVPHNDDGLDDLDDMEEDNGGWHELPSQQWKVI